MRREPSQHWLTVEPVGDVAVARFGQPRILEEEVVESISRVLTRLVEKEGCRKLVLHFGPVEIAATHMLGALVGLNKKLKALGGRMVLCAFTPSLRETFEVLKLHLVFPCCATEPEALQSFQPA